MAVIPAGKTTATRAIHPATSRSHSRSAAAGNVLCSSPRSTACEQIAYHFFVTVLAGFFDGYFTLLFFKVRDPPLSTKKNRTIQP